MSETLWFMSVLVRIHVASGSGDDGISVIEQVARCGDSPPLHIHRTEDELFHVAAGEFFLVPKGVAHSFVVTSTEARWLATTTHGEYEGFVRELSRVPEHEGWPEPLAVSAEISARLDEVKVDAEDIAGMCSWRCASCLS
ncbi:MAG: hypothetical protein WKF41_14110 [Gaiellaceae bacterium]